MRKGGRGRSHPRLIYVLDWSSRSKGSRDVSSCNSRHGRAGVAGAVGLTMAAAVGAATGAGEEGRTRGL